MHRIIRKFRKNKEVTKQKLNKAKSASLKLSLIMLNFIFATFAWFTYTKILNPVVDVNVSAWQVDFKEGDSVLGNAMQFQVGTFYPGMADYAKQIVIENLGDRAASITYKVEQLIILGVPYEVKRTQSEDDEPNTLYVSETINEATGMTSIKLLNNSDKFPFEIILTYSSEINIADVNDATQNKGSFEIRFTWPYEITTLPDVLPDDLEEGLTEEEILEELNKRKNILDTKWGYDIATFYEKQQEGENIQGIEIILQAIAQQII